MGLTPLESGQMACVVTSLEMRARPTPKPLPPSPLRLVEWRTPKLPAYRALFERVGAPWLWFSRLTMDDARLRSIIHDPGIAVFAAVDARGIEVGMLELDFRKAGECELSYLGVVPQLTGQGHGRWLMAHALMLGWRTGVERMWVHTCTLDHPRALGFYIASGFTPFARAFEAFRDPRLTGALPRDAAPQIPLLS